MASPNYTLPSWLQSDPTVPAKNWLTGVQIGAAIGEAKNKLAAQQQQFAVEAQQKQDQLTASALKEAQELQVSKAYNDQQVSLKQQQLKIADEKVGAEIQKAARQFQAQQAYQKDFQSLLNSGKSPDEAARISAFTHLVGESGGRGGFSMPSTLFKQQSPSAPVSTQVLDSQGRKHTILTHGGVMTDIDRNLGRAQSLDPQQRFQMQQQAQVDREKRAQLQREINRLQKMQDEDGSGAMAAESKSKDIAVRQRAMPYLRRQGQIEQYQQALEQLQGGSEDWQGDYAPVQRGQAQPSGGTSGGNAKFRFDPASGQLVPLQGQSASQSNETPDEKEARLLKEILDEHPKTDEEVGTNADNG